MEDDFVCRSCGKTLNAMSRIMHELHCKPLGTESAPSPLEEEAAPNERVYSSHAEEESLPAPVPELATVPATTGQHSTQWTCECCTLVNSIDSQICDACETPRPSQSSQMASNAHNDAVQGSNTPVESTNEDSTLPALPAGVKRRSIEVCLIRHAFSEQNVKVYAFLRMLISIYKLEWPETPILKTLYDFLALLSEDDNAPLAELGERQVKDMHLILKAARYWTTGQKGGGGTPDVIAWSPLRRARDTLFGILPEDTWQEAMARAETGIVQRSSGKLPEFVRLPELVEASPAEHVNLPFFNATFVKRIKDFEKWMQKKALDPKVNRLTICGHSQYFKTMLKQKVLFRNADVQRVKFTVDYVVEPRGVDRAENVQAFYWSSPTLLHRTQLAGAHPFDTLYGRDTESPDSADDASPAQAPANTDEVENDLVTDGESALKQCRICQSTNEEEPEIAHTFIRPCKCTGTQAYVHIECLNRWRATSDTADRYCSVCGYEYKIRTPKYVIFVKSDVGIFTITLAIMLMACWIIGETIVQLGQYLHSNGDTSLPASAADVAAMFYEYSGLYANKGLLTSLKNSGNLMKSRHGGYTLNNMATWWRFCKASSPDYYQEVFKYLNADYIHKTLVQWLWLSWQGYSHWIMSSESVSNSYLKSAWDSIGSNEIDFEKFIENAVVVQENDPALKCVDASLTKSGQPFCVPAYESNWLCNNTVSSIMDSIVVGTWSRGYLICSLI